MSFPLSFSPNQPLCDLLLQYFYVFSGVGKRFVSDDDDEEEDGDDDDNNDDADDDKDDDDGDEDDDDDDNDWLLCCNCIISLHLAN